MGEPSRKGRSSALLIGCLGLMLASLVLGLVLILTVTIPLRDTDPVTAGISLILAAFSFVLAGAGVALAALSRRR
ncbi:MAG TPA: hypothetical protein VFE39_04440 [Pseudonocardia sp.]|nr:hypothetical protein [Pseudonocardia sp.]